jgi:hypothetical protein
VVRGVRFRQNIPGMRFHAVGSTFAGVAVPGDPKLLSTPDQVASQRATWRAYLIPGLLLLVAVGWGVALARRRGARPAATGGTGQGEPR